MAKETEKKKQTGKTAPKSVSSKSTSAKKKTASAKKETSPRKSAPAKKTTSKKSAPKKQIPKEPEQKPLFRKKTIAEKTVAWKSGKTAFILGWLAMIPLLLMIVFFSFFMAGYSFTVLVCWCLIGILLFYNAMYLC